VSSQISHSGCAESNGRSFSSTQESERLPWTARPIPTRAELLGDALRRSITGIRRGVYKTGHPARARAPARTLFRQAVQRVGVEGGVVVGVRANMYEHGLTGPQRGQDPLGHDGGADMPRGSG